MRARVRLIIGPTLFLWEPQTKWLALIFEVTARNGHSKRWKESVLCAPQNAYYYLFRTKVTS